MTANFTFRFPPKTGFSYNVPTYVFLSDNKAKWTTTLKNDGKFSKVFMTQWHYLKFSNITLYNFAILFFSVETVSVIVDTDYSRWAVLAQCMKNEFGQPAFFNSRILSRTRSLSAADMDRARAAIHENQVNGQYTYTVSQDECY